jgi:hypothetical protein
VFSLFGMVREDIVGGLKLALLRGESLKEAMMSFYSAGYKKEDIEEAARIAVQLFKKLPVEKDSIKEKKPAFGEFNTFDKKPLQMPEPLKYTEQKPVITTQKKIHPISNEFEKGVIQKVSRYEDKKKKSLIVPFLIFLLVILLSVLTSIFLFKEKIIEFFNSIF